MVVRLFAAVGVRLRERRSMAVRGVVGEGDEGSCLLVDFSVATLQKM